VSAFLPQYADEARRIAKLVSRLYCARCWWADPADVEQQAWLIASEVWLDGRWVGGVPGYGMLAYVACMRQLGRWLQRQRSPVSASDHGVTSMAGLQTVEIGHRHPVVEPDALQDLTIRDLRDKLRHRLRLRAGDDAAAEASARVLLDGDTPAEAASAVGCPVGDVYRANARALDWARSDAEAKVLVTQLAEAREW